MTCELLEVFVAAGHQVSVNVGDGAGGDWMWRGMAVSGNALAAPAAADVVVVHAGRSWPGVEYRQRTGAKLVMICHNVSAAARDDVAGARPDLVVVNSKTMAAELAVEALVVNPPAPEVRPLPAGDRIVTLSLSDLKGGPQFFQLAQRMPHRRFLAVRSGYGVQQESNLPNVEIIDHVPHDLLLEQVWSRAAVFLQLASSESWGMAASEARAHGIPVVAHPAPGLAENLGDAAIWVNRDDVDMLAAVVERVLAEDLYRARAIARATEIVDASKLQVAEWVTAIERLGS